ncbi:MAG: DUF1553 domain-containing protein [Mariniblastus sp.]|nr:DUF1553 domain-containing protein [Mariniblastus sp.]
MAVSSWLGCLSLNDCQGQVIPEKISFNRHIRPILSDKCFQCHGPDEETREADLRFDQKEDAFRVIEPGNVHQSDIVERILDEDPEVLMPPPEAEKSLSPKEIKLIQEWIRQGASWSEFWAYLPPKKHPLPSLDQSVGNNWIDRFVANRLHQNGFEFSPAADKITLIRRLYFDLIGLPPTPEKVEAFLEDKSGDAVATVVDELLNSQHFGERLAIYWLDLVRYADTVGYHGDQDHNISPYRDWVIDAFNQNMPFDQFTREQLAGDLLPGATESQQVASGYNRLLQTTHEGGLQPKEYTAIYAADRVRNVSLVWMGATVGCAQCHDHKYDPYTSKDFYSLAAFFADIDDEQHFKSGTNTLPTRRPPEILIISTDDRLKLDQAIQQLAELTKEFNQVKKAIEQNKKEAPGPDASAAEKDQSRVGVVDQQKKLDKLSKRLDAAKKLKAKIESRGAWTMVSKPLNSPRTVRLLPRGNWLDESGPIVQASVPEFLGEVKSAQKTPTRLDLANWLTDASEPSGKLTARVFANRFWYQFMGVGISKSLDDFGGQGEAPAFPELLDNLAIEFVENGWDVKQLIRQIVTSQTYQQASLETEAMAKSDPYNQMFQHQSRFRLPAELIRDNLLAISGLLNADSVGGKSIKPAQPAGYYQHLNFPTRKYKQDNDANQWRRGVYVHWQRQFLHPSLKAFDAPSREECTAERPRSNTPSAALALLNDPVFIEAARMFAARILQEATSDRFEDRLTRAFMLAVSRKPELEEIEILRGLYETSLSEFQNDATATEGILAIGQAKTDVTLSAPTLAAWTSVARAILNMNETITRN